jgi:hypothetical protein
MEFRDVIERTQLQRYEPRRRLSEAGERQPGLGLGVESFQRAQQAAVGKRQAPGPGCRRFAGKG